MESGRPIAHVAADLGIHSETLRKHVRQAEADSGSRGDVLTSQEREEIRKLRKEVFELRPPVDTADLEVRLGVFRQGARPRPNEVSAYVQEHRSEERRVGKECRSR